MTADRVPPACRRTRGLVDRVIDESVTPDDRAHAATCPTCGPVLLRAAKFDEELGRTARAFVAEELPRGILDPGLAGPPRVSGRTGAPGLAGMAAAMVIVALAVSVTVLQGGLGGPSTGPSPAASGDIGPKPTAVGPIETAAPTSLAMQGPPLLPTAGIGGSLIQNEWRCSSGRSLASPGSTPETVDHEGIVCTSPKSNLLTSATLITGETIEDSVIEVAVKGDLIVATETAISELAEAMSKAALVSVGDKDRAPSVADWVLTKVPDLKVQPSGDATFGIFGDLRLTLQRAGDGSYFLLIQSQPRG